jgi:hypothetical protein
LTPGALAGLFALNLGYMVMGTAFVWAVRGMPRWSDVARLCGLGYLVGVAAFGVIWTELLVLGVPFGGWQVLATLALGSALAAGAGTWRGVALPERTSSSTSSATSLLVTAVGVALVGLLYEAFFRSARLQSVQAFDAWAFWIPKAKAIYFFGGLDEQIFTLSAGPTYPPLLPILDAAAFHSMGSADVVTLHVQFWFLVLGGVAAIAGCLAGHVPAWALWPSLLLALTLPRFGEALLAPQADVLVDLFFVVGVLLLSLWLEDGHGWRLAPVTVLLSGAALTKREGLLFAAAALVVAFAVASPERRRAWPRLATVTAIVFVAAVPWRLWYRSRGIGGEAPSDVGGSGSAHRAWDALRLSLDVLFDTSLWSVLPFALVLALAFAFAWGSRRQAAYLAAVAILVLLGGAWVTFSYTDLAVTADEALNPIVRYTGALVLLAAAAMPLLLGRGARGRPT